MKKTPAFRSAARKSKPAFYLLASGFLLCFALVSCSNASLASKSSTDVEVSEINRLARVRESRFRSEVVALEDTSKVQPIILTTGEVKNSYEEIALVRIQGMPLGGIESINAGLRSEARKLGANAVVRIQYGAYALGYYSYPQAIGTAVKYK